MTTTKPDRKFKVDVLATINAKTLTVKIKLQLPAGVPYMVGTSSKINADGTMDVAYWPLEKGGEHLYHAISAPVLAPAKPRRAR